MTRQLQFSFGFEPVVEIRAVAPATLEIAVVRAHPDVVFGDFDGIYTWDRRLSAIRTI